jgi:hypothetical protein
MTTKIFLASSAELKDDRTKFEILIGRKNKVWQEHGVFLELVIWEDFIDAMSRTRLQDEYNRAIRECDVFVMLFFTKVGKYTAEEFETAYGQFQTTGKPLVYTYFKDAPVSMASINAADITSLMAFKQKLKDLGHYQTDYVNSEALLLHFLLQLDQLAAKGVIQFKQPAPSASGAGDSGFRAQVIGSGALAIGPGALAIGAGGVNIRGNNSGTINTGAMNTGTQVTNHHGMNASDVPALFAALLAAVNAHAAPSVKAEAVAQVAQLKSEVAKGAAADSGVVAKLVDGLVGLVPDAARTVASTFATPVLSGIAGPLTKWVLETLKLN